MPPRSAQAAASHSDRCVRDSCRIAARRMSKSVVTSEISARRKYSDCGTNTSSELDGVAEWSAWPLLIPRIMCRAQSQQGLRIWHIAILLQVSGSSAHSKEGQSVQLTVPSRDHAARWPHRL